MGLVFLIGCCNTLGRVLDRRHDEISIPQTVFARYGRLWLLVSSLWHRHLSSKVFSKKTLLPLLNKVLIDTVGGKGTFVASPNAEFLREKHVRSVEEKLAEALDLARGAGIPGADVKRMLTLLLESDHD